MLCLEMLKCTQHEHSHGLVISQRSSNYLSKYIHKALYKATVVRMMMAMTILYCLATGAQDCEKLAPKDALADQWDGGGWVGHAL